MLQERVKRGKIPEKVQTRRELPANDVAEGKHHNLCTIISLLTLNGYTGIPTNNTTERT